MRRIDSKLIVDVIFRFCQEQYDELKEVSLVIDDSPFLGDNTSNMLLYYDDESYRSVRMKYSCLAYEEDGFKDCKENFLITDLFKNIEVENNLDCFILGVLHEIGHLARRNNGTYNREKRQHELSKIYLSNTKNRLKIKTRYRAIEEEREADRFASNNYNAVKHILQPTIKLIELSNAREKEIEKLKNELLYEKTKTLNIDKFEVKICKGEECDIQ